MNKGEATVAILGVEPLWSVREVSAYLNVPECTVYGWRTAGVGPPGRLVGRRLRYRRQDVIDWVEALPTEVVS